MNSYRLSRQVWIIVLIAVAMLVASPLASVQASVCTLADHIRSANTNTAVGFCPAGTSHDIITITEDITLSEPLPPITGTITIEGGGHRISGGGEYRIFDVDGGNLTIKNLTLTEGKADHGGAVRQQSGKLSVYESSFVGNRTEKSAGAIYASGGTLEISDSRFEDNCAQLASFALKEGVNRQQRSVDGDGCVHISYTDSGTDGELQINIDGGAIRLANGAQATIERSSFSDNKATFGGAISTSSRDVRLVVNGSSFLGNHASWSGGAVGAVWTGGGATSISNSSFVKNRAESEGGAITASANTFDIRNSSFSENYSDRAGALYVGWEAEVTVTHATFIKNRARYEGAAISKSGGKLYLRNSIIDGAGGAGDCVGGLDQSIGNLSPDRTCGLPLSGELLLDDLTGSPAHYPLLDRSAAVDVAVAEYCLGTDQLGTARPQGGGCDIGAVESTTAKPAEFETPPFCPLPDQIIAANTDRPYRACPAGNGPDTIYLIRDIVLTEKLQPITSDITIEGNGYTISGDSEFRIFDVDGGMLTVKNLTMTEGRGRDDGGGAIRLQNNGRTVVSDSRFVKNRAQNGGAIFVGSGRANKSSVTVNNSSFLENSALYGGAIYVGSGRISVSNSSFVKNRARFSDGAIVMINYIRADIDNSTFIENTPSAMSADNGVTLTLTHVTIQDRYTPPVLLPSTFYAAPSWINLRNSIIAGRGFDPKDCDSLKQNIGNLIEDGSCSPRLSGDPMLEEATGSPAYLDLGAGSPAIEAADARFCTDTDQIGNTRPQGGGCDIGAIESGAAPPEAPASSADAPAQANCQVTTTHALNFRDGPNGVRIGSVPPQATLVAIARTAGWFHVEYRGIAGWISADYVVAQGVCG